MNKTSTIYGPPGTGKTRTLSEIAAEEAGIVSRVAFLSYTRAAAKEAAGRTDSDIIDTRTLHSMAYAALGVNRASIVNRSKLMEFSRVTGIPFQGAEGDTDEEQQDGDIYLAVQQFARNRMIEPLDVYDLFGRPGQIAQFEMMLDAYASWKNTYGYLDFDDILEQFINAQSVNVAEPPVFPVVILDEAQDCSPLQWRVFSLIAARAERVYIAGDDDQAIYEWSGADPHGMNAYTEHVNGNARVLAQSHRVPRLVQKFALDAIISQMKRRVDKVFDPAPRDGTVTRYGDILDFPFNSLLGADSAMILVRDRWRMKETQRMLHAELIPYRVAGAQPSPYENRWAHAIRGVGRIVCDSAGPTRAEITAMDKCVLPDAALLIRDKRWADLARLGWKRALAVPAYLRPFYESADLWAPIKVVLSTIHAAKGTEADDVVVDLTLSPKTQEGVYNDRDAELRVMYVAVTRARHNLVLCGSNQLI